MSSISTKKKPSLLCNTKRVKENKQRRCSSADIDQPLFQPYPTELVFQNFTAGQTYNLPLHLHNNDKVSRHVKLEQQDSIYFSVVGPSDGRSNVAPGMCATFKVSFTPHDNKDYHHRPVCVTEREKFEIPVRAVGPRAILDFRDEIDLPVCPVKASTEKTQLVSNIGNSKAKFVLYTKRPFSVTPEFGSLDVGESMQVTVFFHPMNAGEHRQDLLLHYHTVFEDQSCCAMCADYKPPVSGPQIRDWIQCDNCDRWFHALCLDIKSTEYEKAKRGSWKCPLCN